MKLFQHLQNDLALLGVEPNQKYAINKSNVMSMLCYGTFVIFAFMRFFLAIDDQNTSVIEKTNNIYFAAAGGLMFSIYMHTILNAKKLFEFIKNCEKEFDKSE